MIGTDGESGLAVTLIDAYRATHYCITGIYPAFLMCIDAYSADPAACHRPHDAACATFVTAWNPRSRPIEPEHNAAAGERLEAQLRSTGHTCVKGLSVDPTGRWEGEESLLVLGLGHEQAVAIAREYEQNGLLWTGEDAVPRLLLLR